MTDENIKKMTARITALEQFLRDDIRDALLDLESYIGSHSWTRHQQAEIDDCRRMIKKLNELIGD